MNSFSGRPPILDNPHAPRVRKVSGLAGRSARTRSGLLLVEGPQALRELISHRPSTLTDVYVSRSAEELYGDIVEAARKVTRWVHPVSEDVARALSADSQGICATALLEAIDREAPGELGAGDTLVVLAQGRDPGNVGTIIRTADAMGARAVLSVAGTVDVTSPKVVRSSAGSLFHLPIVHFPSFVAASSWLRERGVRALGTSGGAGTLSLPDLLVQGISGGGMLSHAHAWVLGNEARGLSEEEMRSCDALVSIPMTGDAESLNVANAAAMCLFASQTVRMQRGATASRTV